MCAPPLTLFFQDLGNWAHHVQMDNLPDEAMRAAASAGVRRRARRLLSSSPQWSQIQCPHNKRAPPALTPRPLPLATAPQVSFIFSCKIEGKEIAGEGGAGACGTSGAGAGASGRCVRFAVFLR